MENKNFPKRKPTRLKYYDYSQPGAYFVTICTKDKINILSEINIGEGLCALPKYKLTTAGLIVDETIKYVIESDNSVNIEKYVIMPNHIHMIIALNDTGGDGTPPLHKIVGEIKSYTTKRYGRKLWQRSFHDHIIRGKDDYLKIWEYIDNNIQKWELDCFYTQ